MEGQAVLAVAHCPCNCTANLLGVSSEGSRHKSREVSRAFVLSSPCRRNTHQRHNPFRAHSHRHNTEAWGDAPDKPNSLSTISTNATVILPSRAANRYRIQQSRGQAKVGSANIRATGRKTAATTKNNTCACHTCMKLDPVCGLPREPPRSEHTFTVGVFGWPFKPRCLMPCPRRHILGESTATNTTNYSTCITHFVMPQTPAMLGTLVRHQL